MPASAVTALPRAQTPTVEMVNGNSDVQITAANRADYGDWVAQFRGVGDDTWITFGRTDHATASTATTGFSHGTRYEFRVYNRTEHVIGPGCPPTTFTVPLADPSGLQVADRTITSITLSWTDNSSFAGTEAFVLERRENNEYGQWKEVERVGGETTTATDNGLTPGSSYVYRVAILGQDYVGYSDPLVASTADPGVPNSAIPPQGWYVVIAHPNGELVEPPVIGSPNWEPALNDYPEVQIPVPCDERWLQPAFEGAGMKVWKDGQRLPIDAMEDVRVAPDQYTLVGRGGLELEQHVTRQYDESAVHLAAHDLIETAGYQANVDAPNATTSEGITLQRATTTTDLEALVGDVPADQPVEVAGGKVRLLQSAWWAQEDTLFPDRTRVSGPYTGGYAVEFDQTNSGIEGSTTIEPDYQLPPETRVAIRVGVSGESGDQYIPSFEVLVDGEVAWAPIPQLWDHADGDVIWLNSPQLESALDAGEHEITLRNRGGGEYTLHVDAIVCYDSRFNYDFAAFEQVGQSNYLAGPQLYPDSLDVDLGEIQAGRLVTFAELSADFSSIAGNQALALSDDGGQTWVEATNSGSVSADFSSDPSTTLQVRATLSRYGYDRSAPATGVRGQTLSNVEVVGVLDSTPTLVGNAYEGSVMSVLQEIAEFGDFIFEIRRDSGTYSVEWCEPGQRTSSRSEAITDYDVDKVSSEQYGKVVVKGAGRPVVGETFVASVGSWVDLSEDYVIEGKTSVYDSDGTSYEYGNDYTIRPLTGEIQALASGAMNDGGTYTIDYQYKVTGSYTSATSGSNPRTRYVNLPNANTVSRCEQLAVTIGDQVDDPYWTATVTIPELPPDLSLVSAISLEGLPLDPGGLEVMNMKQKPESVRLQLGSRSPLEETISRLQKQLASVAAKA